MLLTMDDRGFDEPTQARRAGAIGLAARIRIALPYRRATQADLVAVDAELARLAACGLAAGDEVVVELQTLRDTLEILAIGSDA